MFLLFLERKWGGEERQKHRLVASVCAWTSDWTCILGMCTDWELNLRTFDVWDESSTSWARWCESLKHGLSLTLYINTNGSITYTSPGSPAEQREIWDNYRGHPDLNWGPLDLQSNALPLSYTPCWNEWAFSGLLLWVATPKTSVITMAPNVY